MRGRNFRNARQKAQCQVLRDNNDKIDGNYILIRIGKQSAEALLDSGAACSMINKSFAQQLKLRIQPPTASPDKMVSANGGKITTVGTVTMDLYLQGGAKMEHVVAVAEELIPNFILGMNFLLENRANLNFATRPPTLSL